MASAIRASRAVLGRSMDGTTAAVSSARWNALGASRGSCRLRGQFQCTEALIELGHESRRVKM